MKMILGLCFCLTLTLVVPRPAFACDDAHQHHNPSVRVSVSAPLPVVVAYCSYGHAIYDGYRNCRHGHGYFSPYIVTGYAWNPAGFWYRTNTHATVRERHSSHHRSSQHRSHRHH
jgi:hypothetical protein